ncbi:hypothetical protein R3P38DRAFT_2793740 [Favolaschia claudopus]|uniref:Uncharacterized protein n=1 Tax=Favolaschia claudopus TaxID=2862362 RepID=A0AAW0ABL3_9AGAR
MATSTPIPVIVPATAPIVARHLTKTKVFHEDDAYPPPLPVLLKDTDFPLPVFEPLYANTTPILGVEPPSRLPQTNASTPFNGIDPENYTTSLDAHLSKPMHEKLKAAFDDAAPNFLNFSRSFTEQDSGDIESFKAEFEQDWAFQGIVTNLLRNRKASLHREQAAELAAIASGKKINERTKAPRKSVA